MERSIPIIPIAIDTQEIHPISGRAGSTNILTLGTLHYPPNADGIRWFVSEVFPHIQRQVPETTLTIVGKNPPKDFYNFAALYSNAVTVTGYVPDLTTYLEEAALLVVPVRAGGGMRVRILEAFARAMPVVTTAVGMEGINARPGEALLVADTPVQFARAVVQLLSDETLRKKLAINGRLLAEKNYDWRVVLQDLNRVYTTIAGQLSTVV